MLRTTIQQGVLRVRTGHGANCSSIGSVIDLLFATATVGGALYAALSATLADEANNLETVTAKSDQPTSAAEHAETTEASQTSPEES